MSGRGNVIRKYSKQWTTCTCCDTCKTLTPSDEHVCVSCVVFGTRREVKHMLTARLQFYWHLTHVCATFQRLWLFHMVWNGWPQQHLNTAANILSFKVVSDCWTCISHSGHLHALTAMGVLCFNLQKSITRVWHHANLQSFDQRYRYCHGFSPVCGKTENWVRNAVARKPNLWSGGKGSTFSCFLRPEPT